MRRGHLSRRESKERRKAKGCRRDAGDAADQAEQQALEHQRLHDAPRRCAERDADADFGGPRLAAREEQVRDVRARQREEHGRGNREQRRRASGAPQHPVADRRQRGGVAIEPERVLSRVTLRPSLLQRGDLRSCVFRTGPLPQQREHVQSVARAIRRPGRGIEHGVQPDVRVAARQLDVRRECPDDLDRTGARWQRARSEDARVAAVGVSPETVGEHRDGRGARTIVACIRQPPRGRARADNRVDVADRVRHVDGYGQGRPARRRTRASRRSTHRCVRNCGRRQPDP